MSPAETLRAAIGTLYNSVPSASASPSVQRHAAALRDWLRRDPASAMMAIMNAAIDAETPELAQAVIATLGRSVSL